MLNKDKELHIVIDTDPGTDDTIALALASTFFKKSISALISSYGNVNGEQTYKNLKSLAQLLDIDCTILKGSMNPINSGNITYTDYHGNNGLCGIQIPLIEQKTNNINIIMDKSNSFNELYKIIKNKKHVKYISIAPLTNFVRLIRSYKDTIKYIDELIIMGGGFNCHNVKHRAEYNFSLDGYAVQEALNLPLKKTICPLDLTQKYVFSEKEIEKIVGCKRSTVFEDQSQFGLISQIFFKNYDTAVLHNQTGAIIHDATTLLYLLAPDKCKTTTTKIKSNTWGTVKKCNDGELVKIVQDIDKEILTLTLREMFKKLER